MPTSGSAPVELSVILPAYNEGAQLTWAIKRLAAELGELGFSAEIVLVDDGSTDNTPDVEWSKLVDFIQVQYVRHELQRGKGHAVLTGLRTARGQCVVYTDADLPIGPSHVKQAIRLIRSGSVEVVIGNRFHADSDVTGDAGSARRIASRVIRFAARRLVIRGINDPQCCLKAMRTEAALAVQQHMSLGGYAFDVELIYLAHKLGFTIEEIPVSWTDCRARINAWTLMGRTVAMLWDINSVPYRHPASKFK